MPSDTQEQRDKRRFTTGAHCGSCWGRQKCPEYALLAHDGPIPPITEDNAAQLILRAKALEGLAEALTNEVKVFAERGGVVKDPTTGKVYLPTLQKGRKSLDQEALAKVVDLEKYQRVGKPFNKYSWVKP